MTDFMTSGNTQVSNPSAPIGGGQVMSNAAPGAGGPGGQMGTAASVIWLIGGAAAIAVGTAYLGRKGVKPTLGHLDLWDSMFNAASVVVWLGTFKVLAYRYHGHKIAQAYLLVV